jgi:hypothetical protein
MSRRICGSEPFKAPNSDSLKIRTDAAAPAVLRKSRRLLFLIIVFAHFQNVINAAKPLLNSTIDFPQKCPADFLFATNNCLSWITKPFREPSRTGQCPSGSSAGCPRHI